MLFDDLHRHAAEGVITHLAHQAHFGAKEFERQAGVAHWPANVDLGVFDVDQFARHQDLPDLALQSFGEDRRDIQADVPGGYNFYW